ncbi:hypothetical protein Shyd_03630 [Streptomyces hydrogenans]|uniref:Uncharacterized protein n=1 Tax=Streptomyces hydrogenans TaxID=1873719 RepID=A0ABQ3P1U6_9ACTN|nr:hypothetical protein GCM10018784_64990 [Streptomyces hydrogenans]GHI18992.1 hypothetical protein Shyd_03630 [Streptomyces hydrogenans]
MASLGRVACLDTSWDLAPAHVTGRQGTAARSPKKGGRSRGRPGPTATGPPSAPHGPSPTTRPPPTSLPRSGAPPGAAALGTAAALTPVPTQGPCRDRNRGTGPFAYPSTLCDARHTKIPCNAYNQRRGPVVIYAATPKSRKGAALGGGCSALSVCPAPSPSGFVRPARPRAVRTSPAGP